MKKPLIAIVGGLVRDNSNEFLGDNYIKINSNYSKSIVDAGGIPIILPLVNDINVLINQISICNGLLLTGGIDINPLLYKESPQPLLETCNDLTDWFHINLARKALDLNIPILGICRGCQVINVAFGGTLYQDITYATSSPIMHKQKSHLSQRCHYIYVKENSIIYDILGNEYVVNSAHHQSVEKIASNFICTASSEDGIIEAIEMINKPFVVGVQWHPEMMVSYDIKALNLFKRFIESCKI